MEKMWIDAMMYKNYLYWFLLYSVKFELFFFFSNSCAQEKPTATLIISLPTGLVDPSNLLPPVIPALSSRNKEKEP